MSERTRQQRWRTNTFEKRRKFSITVHLSPLDAATLDAIAVQLYQAVPHAPHNEPPIDGSGFFPSRAQAVRQLCAEWRQQNPDQNPSRFKRLRNALSVFWRDEAVWRACNEHSDPDTKPRPPWRR
jgi:hypothetical protein